MSTQMHHPDSPLPSADSGASRSAEEAWRRICARYRLDPICAEPRGVASEAS